MYKKYKSLVDELIWIPSNWFLKLLSFLFYALFKTPKKTLNGKVYVIKRNFWGVVEQIESEKNGITEFIIFSKGELITVYYLNKKNRLCGRHLIFLKNHKKAKEEHTVYNINYVEGERSGYGYGYIVNNTDPQELYYL